jgi:hypothetical protein
LAPAQASTFANATDADDTGSVTISASLPITSSASAASLANTTVSADNATDSASVDTTGIVAADNSTDATNATLVSRRFTTFWSRIAQADLPDVAQKWQDLCLASGGDIFTDEPCVVLAGFDGINALLADADACAQQDVADAMIDFANSEGIVNRKDLIAQAIAYRKHPRNSIEILGVTPSSLYCNRAPRNPELKGIVNTQLDGVDPGLFGSPSVPMVAFGADGTCPFGSSPDVSTCACVQDSATADPVIGNTTDSSDSSGSTADETSISSADGTADDSDSSGGSTDDSSTDDSSDNTDDSSDNSDDSTDNSTDDSTDDTSDSTSTDDSDTSDDNDAPDSTSTSTDTDPTTYVDAADSSDSTGSAADSSSTVAATSVATPPATTTTSIAFNPAESVFQPSDISGNVNDPAGR